MEAESTPHLERLRSICLSLPKVTERVSHGEPTWFVNDKRSFVMFSNHHHGARLSFWCAAFPGIQALLVDAEPERYFRPPYVGHRGWLGVFLDVAVDWDTVATLVSDAYKLVAPKGLAAIVAEDHSSS